MASELGLIYSVGRHWTGSMIELYGCGHKLVGGSPEVASHFSRRNSLTSVLERLLEATTTSKGDCHNGDVYASCNVGRYLVSMMQERGQLRHSLTCLWPAHHLSSNDVVGPCFYPDLELKQQRLRCRSSEPSCVPRERRTVSATHSDVGAPKYSSPAVQYGPLGPGAKAFVSPRKRLSMSDSEIRYVGENQTGEGENGGCRPDFEDDEDGEDRIVCASEEQEEELSICNEKETLEVANAGDVSDWHLGSLPTDEAVDSAEPDSKTAPPPVCEQETTASDDEVKKPAKKSVRFADEVGSDLTQERLIEDTSLPPKLQRFRLDSFDDDFRDLGDIEDPLPGVHHPCGGFPKHNSSPQLGWMPPPVPTLHHSCSSNSSLLSLSSAASPGFVPSSRPPAPEEVTWRLTFAQPAAQYLAFRQRLEANSVSLENVSVSKSSEKPQTRVCLYGTVKVKNIAFEKHVRLRVTRDNWVTHRDYPASHNAELSHGSGNQFDTFMFNLSEDFEEMEEGGGSGGEATLQFAVCFVAGANGSGGEFWDNNDGCNYVIVREAPKPTPNEFFRQGPSSIVGGNEGGGVLLGGGEFAGMVGSPQQGVAAGTNTLTMGQPHHSQHQHHPVYTLDYRPNFEGFASLTSYSSWQHYSSESMYY